MIILGCEMGVPPFKETPVCPTLWQWIIPCWWTSWRGVRGWQEPVVVERFGKDKPGLLSFFKGDLKSHENTQVICFFLGISQNFLCCGYLFIKVENALCETLVKFVQMYCLHSNSKWLWCWYSCWHAEKIHLCHDLPPFVPYKKQMLQSSPRRNSEQWDILRIGLVAGTGKGWIMSAGHCLMPRNLPCSLGMNISQIFHLSLKKKNLDTKQKVVFQIERKIKASFEIWLVLTRRWQLKYILFSPRTLEKWSNLTTVLFFKGVETTN